MPTPAPTQKMPQGDPHSAGFFSNLFRMFRRGDIPANLVTAGSPSCKAADDEDGACPVDGDIGAMGLWH